MDKKISIAIDGPAAAGKSTVAKMIASNLSYIYIDTGAMYRALTYKALQMNIHLHDGAALSKVLIDTKIDLYPSKDGQLVFLDGKNVTRSIRSPEVSNSVSIVAQHRHVREEMVRRQQQLAQSGGVVMDGRDIGTHVLPMAELKIFLLASVEERARRRHEENIRNDIPSNLAQIKEEIAQRDKLDSEREVSPLKKADDAMELDTTSLTIPEVVTRIMSLAQERIG